jgi:hypothetical protein
MQGAHAHSSHQAAEPVGSLKFHYWIAAVVILVVIAQAVFCLLYRLKISK